MSWIPLQGPPFSSLFEQREEGVSDARLRLKLCVGSCFCQVGGWLKFVLSYSTVGLELQFSVQLRC